MASRICRFAVKTARNAFDQPKVFQVPSRSMSDVHPKIKAKQEHYLKEDDTPIYIKGGPMDQILYRSTMGACVLAIGLFVYNMAELVFVKK